MLHVCYSQWEHQNKGLCLDRKPEGATQDEWTVKLMNGVLKLQDQKLAATEKYLALWSFGITTFTFISPYKARIWCSAAGELSN